MGAVMFTAIVIGCGPRLPDAQVHGERVAVGTQDEVLFCGGTVDALDRHVQRIEDTLGVEAEGPAPLTVYMVEDTRPWCGESLACYRGGFVDASIVPASQSRVVWHELVHQVVTRSRIGSTDRLLSEGMAMVLGDDACAAEPLHPEESATAAERLGLRKIEYDDYFHGARLVAFVLGHYGSDTLVELARCMDRNAKEALVDRCIEQTLGLDRAQLAEELAVAPPMLRPNPATCEGEVVVADSGVLRLWAPLACDDPEVVNTFAGVEDREVSRLIAVPIAGSWRIDAQAAGEVEVSIEPCFCAGGLPTPSYDRATHTAEITVPGVYRVSVRTSDPAVTSTELALWAL
jgi:hypothetical protein